MHTILKGHKEESQRNIDLSVWSYIHFFGMSGTVALVNQESEQNGGKKGEEEDDESTRNTIMFCNCNQKIVYNWNFLCEQEEFELSTSVCLSNSNKDF